VTVAAAMAEALATGTADALDPPDWFAAEVAAVAAAAVGVAAVAAAFDFVAGLHAVEHNATTATAAAAESARTFIAAPCFKDGPGHRSGRSYETNRP